MCLACQVRFYVRLRHVHAPFPWPAHLGSVEDYLLTASVVPGHEEAGPTAHVPFDTHAAPAIEPPQTFARLAPRACCF